ncbi:hypothetical protein DV515_00016463 [Chloebia gouldiae]|uniref:Uncharacterized protein n=1 Tax=Chloebia gouldiae TaxID=44316 RepID=A0A3L8RS27_CHLGU|nr:hypothetical protein DV515_00016463 [Chloebia gouldiae]
MLRAEQDNDIGWMFMGQFGMEEALGAHPVMPLLKERPQEINKEELEGNSMRCGRKLAKDGDLSQAGAGRDPQTPQCSSGRPLGAGVAPPLRVTAPPPCVPSVSPLCPLCVPSVLQYCWRWTGFNFGLDLLVTYTNRYIIFKRNTLNQPCSGSVSLQPRRSIAFRLRLASFDCSGKMICSRTTGYQILTLEKDQEQIVMNLDSRLLTFPLYICCNFLYTSPEKRADSEAQLDHLEA